MEDSFVGNPFSHTFSYEGIHDVEVNYYAVNYCTNTDYINYARQSVWVYPAPSIYGIRYDEANGIVVADMANSTGCTFTWYLEGDLLIGMTSSSIPYQGPGFYTCEVTDANGCTKRYREFIPFNPPCTDVGWNDIQPDFCEGTLTLWSNITGIGDIEWEIKGGDYEIIDYYHFSRQVTIKFFDVGTYKITARRQGFSCQKSEYVYHVDFIPDFTFEKQCNQIVIHNNSKSLSGNETITVSINGYTHTFSVRDQYYAIIVAPSGTYTFNISIAGNGITRTCYNYSVSF